MTDVTPPQQRLAARLRELRLGWPGGPLTQRQLADGLGTSTALVSSWEKGSAVPPEDRLRSYALFFCTESSVVDGTVNRVRPEELTPTEERRREQLVEELALLRDQALDRPDPQYRQTGALGGRFWYFPDGQPVTILCTPLTNRQLGIGDRVDQQDPLIGQYAANPTHPNAIYHLANGDVDALLELVGHIRAENPTLEVRWSTHDRVNEADLLSGHVVLLGGSVDIGMRPGTEDEVVTFFTRQLDLPVVGREFGDDIEFDLEFAVKVDDDGQPDRDGPREEIYRPRFIRDERSEGRPRLLSGGAPQLEYDVALLMRKPNPVNTAASLTICSGIFSRGTYGAVRAFTDAILRARNERYVAESFDPQNFWMLIQVPVFAGRRTLTPDLARAAHRLRTS